MKPSRKRLTSGNWSIYIVSEGMDGPVKIGKTTRLTWRLDEIQSCNPRKVTMPEFWMMDCREVHRAEKDIHRELEPYRIQGEWFDLPYRYASDLVKKLMEDRYPNSNPVRDYEIQKIQATAVIFHERVIP